MAKQLSKVPSQQSSIVPLQGKRSTDASSAFREQRLRALEAAGVGTWSWDVTKNKIEWDSRCKELFGVPDFAQNIPYEDFVVRLHPDDRESTRMALLRAVEEGGNYDMVHRALWPDGSIHWLRCIGRVADGVPRRLTGLSIDVSWAKDLDEQHLHIQENLRLKAEELEQSVRERTAELERQTAHALEQARLLDLANDAVFVRDVDSRISYWNEGAERLYGWSRNEALGRSTHDLLHTEFPVPLSEILSSDRWEGELKHRKGDGTVITVASRWTTLRDDQGHPIAYLEINTDISARKEAEERAKHLAARILAVQDEEQRRLARELHDSLGQYLAALKMNLDWISSIPDEPGRRTKAECLTECLELVETCLTETRTLSHLMHPPMLDEAGLASALKCYVEGFVERSGIEADLTISSEFPRLRSDVELTLFRSVQEAVTNAHRHSNCSKVEVTLAVDADFARVSVRDNGVGMPESKLTGIRQSNIAAGVGLAGMRERVSELGGKLELSSDSSGTAVTVVIPAFLADSGGIVRLAG